MAANAVGSGRQRALLQQAQGLAAQLRALPPAAASPSNGEEALPEGLGLLQELVRVVGRLRGSTAALDDPEQRAIWEQRGAWLHEEVLALTAERLQGGDPQQFWHALAALLYVGADATEAVAAEKAKVQAALDAEQQRVALLEERLASNAAAGSSKGQGTVSSSGGGQEEVLELKTRLVVAQQEAQRRAADAKDMTQRLQAALAERDSWRKQCTVQQEQWDRQAEAAGRQSKVIAQLMARSEEAAKQAQAATASAEQLGAHNRTLSVNLEAHARVVEKLIGLNTELMDVANEKAFGRGGPAPLPPTLELAQVQVELAAAVPPPTFGQTSSSDGPPPPPPLPLSTPLQPIASTTKPLLPPLGALNHAPQLHGMSNGGPPPAWQPTKPPASLGAAFEAFLQDEPQPAGADTLAVPPPSMGAIQHGSDYQHANGSGGRGGIFSKVVNLGKYIAGNDDAVQIRAQQLGQHHGLQEGDLVCGTGIQRLDGLL